MHDTQTAAGYDAFGLERYSRLADSMKLWGDLSEPERSLREGRELDVLNVRYLISKPLQVDSSRWRQVARFGDATVYENLRALPRAWLTTGVVRQADDVLLNTIRTGKFPDGSL